MSSSTTFRSLSQTTPPALSRLMQRAQQLHHTALTIKGLLPENLARQCQPGNIVGNDTLFIYVNSPVWATRLRYFSPELIKRLQNHPGTKNICHIRIAVNPVTIIQTPDNKSHRYLSQENATLLHHAADTAASPRLSAALQRLAKHTCQEMII